MRVANHCSTSTCSVYVQALPWSRVTGGHMFHIHPCIVQVCSSNLPTVHLCIFYSSWDTLICVTYVAVRLNVVHVYHCVWYIHSKSMWLTSPDSCIGIEKYRYTYTTREVKIQRKRLSRQSLIYTRCKHREKPSNDEDTNQTSIMCGEVWDNEENAIYLSVI